MKEFDKIEKAGRLIRLYGWLMLIVPIAIAASILVPAIHDRSFDKEPSAMLFLTLLFLSLPIFTLFVGSKVKKNIKWAKITSLFLTLIILFIPPVGTVLAVFIYYYLFKGWHET